MLRRIALVCVLGACAGCPLPARRPRPAPPAPAAVSEYTVREASLDGGALTVRLEIPNTPPGPKPAVIAYLGEGALLRAAGMIAVGFTDWRAPKQEPPATPNPVGKWVLASPTAGVLGREYLRAITRIGQQIVPRVVDYLGTDPAVDASRIGITGTSTNGFMALEAASVDKRIVATVAANACGDYHLFLRYSSMGMDGQPLALDPEYDRWLRGLEPITHPDAIVHTALMMIDHVEDNLIPIQCAESTARVFERAYARARAAERFKFVAVKEGGHGTSLAEQQEAVAWLGRWLHP